MKQANFYTQDPEDLIRKREEDKAARIAEAYRLQEERIRKDKEQELVELDIELKRKQLNHLDFPATNNGGDFLMGGLLGGIIGGNLFR